MKDGKPISAIEAWTRVQPQIDHMRAWGSVCYSHVPLKSQPRDARTDKLVPRGRIGVFMGYSDSTDKHFKVYAPDRGYTITLHVVDVYESKKGGLIDLRIRSSPTGQGIPNTLQIALLVVGHGSNLLDQLLLPH